MDFKIAFDDIPVVCRMDEPSRSAIITWQDRMEINYMFFLNFEAFHGNGDINSKKIRGLDYRSIDMLYRAQVHLHKWLIVNIPIVLRLIVGYK